MPTGTLAMRKPISSHWTVLLPLLVLAGCGDREATESADRIPPDPAWHRGALHMQSYWSDGDDYPEMILHRYAELGYDFAAMSDHDRLAEGERWISFSINSDSMQVFREYLETFGESRVTRERSDSMLRVRLATFERYRSVPAYDSLLVLQSEEISDSHNGNPIHLNAVNLAEAVAPQGGGSAAGIVRNNLRAVRSQERRTRRPILLQLNHPNYGGALRAADLMELPELRFMEIFNGHPSVRNYGEGGGSTAEEQWDAVNAWRVPRGQPLLYGTASDDAHDYHEEGPRFSNPDRGWVQVWCRGLRADSLIGAMRRGRFYASSGVRLRGLRADSAGLALAIEGEEGVTYTTQFVGALDVHPADGGVPPDTVLAEATGLQPSYTYTGEELFLRARVISSRTKANPYRPGDREMAWTQPVRPGGSAMVLGFFNSTGND